MLVPALWCCLRVQHARALDTTDDAGARQPWARPCLAKDEAAGP